MYEERKIIKENLDKILIMANNVDWFDLNCKMEMLLDHAHEAEIILQKLENRDKDYVNQYNKFVDKYLIRYPFLTKVIDKKRNIPSYFG